jgi:hypothetical protein
MIKDMRVIASELRDECSEFVDLLGSLTLDQWQWPTQFKNWTATDIVRHLYIADERAVAAAEVK